MNINKTGLALGVFFAVVHALWLLAVLMGVGQWYLDFVFGLHILSNPFAVLNFSWGSAIGLLIVTFVSGYVFGAIFAWVWNKFTK